MEHVSKKYGEKLIFRDTNVHIERGDKIALIGANGKGKSTLMRLVAGTEAPTNGKHQLGHNVIMSFYAQHQLESLTHRQRDSAGDERGRLEAQRNGAALGAGLVPVHGRGGVQENQGAERAARKAAWPWPKP